MTAPCRRARSHAWCSAGLIALLLAGPTLAKAEAPSLSERPPATAVTPPQPLMAAPASTGAEGTWGLPPVPPPSPGRDPYLDRPDAPQSGFFTHAELAIAKPHLRNRLISSMVVSPAFGTSVVQAPPDARLDWTVEPTFEVGYHVPDGFGDFRISYRFVSDDGTSQARTRLDLNDINLDYTTWEFSPWPHWEMNWNVGVKVATLFFDSQFNRPYVPNGPAGLTAESVSNTMAGAGPRTGLTLSWQTPCPGWSLKGHVEAAALWVMITQRFHETSVVPAAPGSGYDSIRKPQGVPQLGARFGLEFDPRGSDRWGFFAGYAWEGWWTVGRVDANGSRADLFQNGIVFRAEYTW